MTKKIKKNRGFVLLFAVTLAAVFLSIALGISEVALKENNFSTSAKNTNDAFFAADTGEECALYYDNSSDSTKNAFTGTGSMNCNGLPITITGTGSPANIWTFVVSGLGSTGKACTKVTVDKSSDVVLPATTAITASGYNNGSGSGVCNPLPSAVERVLQTSY
jgi:hypothetical protein